ncbi:MAG: inositol monophosphatase [Oligoflexia bacterium]|nr:inositol monophosphatase [Oligoflexia bacterium]
MNTITPKERDKVISAVRKAGEELMSFWPGASVGNGHKLEIIEKSDGSYVTSADYASNAIIVEMLRSLFPTDSILSEEMEPPASSSGREWILDPLDGTHLFIDGRDSFAIFLALAIEGRADFGVVYFPARRQLLHAIRGSGAFLNEQRLRVSCNAALRPKSIRVRGVTGGLKEWEADRSLDSGSSIVQLCEGKLDGLLILAPRFGHWDLAAPTIVIEESGGTVTTRDGQALTFGAAIPEYTSYIASNGVLHSQLLSLVPKED